MLTREQLIQNIEALEKQGASQSEVQEYIDSQSKQPVQQPAQKDVGIVRTIGGALTKPFEKLSATAQKYGGGAVAYGLDVLTPSKKTYSSFKEATQKVGSGYDKGAFSATKALTGETPQPVNSLSDLAGTSLEAASIFAPVVKAPAFLFKIAKGKIGAAALEGGLTAGASGFVGGTGIGLQEGKDIVGSLEKGVVEGAIAAPLGVALGGVAGGLVRAPKLATKSGRQQVALQSAKEQFSKDLDEVLSTKSLSKATSELEKANVPIREILNDLEIAQGIKVSNKAINVDDAVAVTQKNLDLAQNAKAKLLPEIDKFAPRVSKEEIRSEAIKDIIGKETNLDEKNLIARINAQIDAMDDNLSLSQIDAERRRFYNSGRTAKGEQRGDSEYAAIENALRKVLFDKTDNLPQGIDTTGEIKGLNTYIRQQLKAQQFLDKNLRGQTVKGGKLGEYFARGIGAVAGSQGGILGSLAGSEIAGYVSNVLTNNKLGSSVKMRLISNIAEETGDPTIIKAADDLIKRLKLKPTLQLPAPSSGFKSVMPSKGTINLGAQTIDELPAQKINRTQSEPSISRQNVANKTITINPNTSIPQSLQQPAKSSNKLSTPKGLLNTAIENLKNPSKRQGGYIRNPLAKKELTKSSSLSSTNDITDDIGKAKASGQSFDEWVKGQWEMLYHGGGNLKEVGNMRSKWGAFYMTENPTYAKSYGGKNSTLNEMLLSKNAKIADLRKPSGDLIKQIDEVISPKETGKNIIITRPDGTKLTIPEKKGGLSNPVHSSADIIQGIKDGKAYFAEMPEVKEALKKLGYDGMITQESKFGANYGVWNKDVIKTRSQLKAEWDAIPSKTMTAQEAKKAGMSFDEWVKGQGETLYHGTPENISVLKNTRTGENNYGKGGVFLTPDKEEAFTYGGGYLTQDKTNARVLEAYVSPKAKIKEIDGKKLFNNEQVRDDKIAPLVRQAEKDGYDGVVIKNTWTTSKTKNLYSRQTELNGLRRSKVFSEIEDVVLSDKSVKDGVSYERKYNELIKSNPEAIKIKNRISQLEKEISDLNQRHLVIFNDEVLKTRSQLKAEWDSVEKLPQGKSLSNDLIEASVASKLPPQRVPVTKPNFTPEIKNNIADIIDLLRGKRVSKIREEELLSDMAAIIEDFGFGIPRTTAGKVKLLDLIYNGAI